MEHINKAKTSITSAIAILTALWGWFGWVVVLFVCCMAADYATVKSLNDYADNAATTAAGAVKGSTEIGIGVDGALSVLDIDCGELL